MIRKISIANSGSLPGRLHTKTSCLTLRRLNERRCQNRQPQSNYQTAGASRLPASRLTWVAYLTKPFFSRAGWSCSTRATTTQRKRSRRRFRSLMSRLGVGYLATKNEKGSYVGGKLAIVDTSSGAIERESDVGFFPYALRFLYGKLYVTLVGEHKLLVVGRDLKLIKRIDVGRNPQGMCSDGKSLYVVNSSSDSLSVLDARSDRVARTINLARPGSRFGVAPTSCAVSGGRLYVTLAGTNANAVLNKTTGRTLALIPTGWYPTKVLARDNQVFVLSAKGIRARYPNPKGPQADGGGREGEYVLTLLKGTTIGLRAFW